MNGRFSKYQTARWMDTLASRTLYMALFTSDPYAVSNPLTVELLGTSITRQPSTWERTSPYSLELRNDIFFYAIPSETSIVAIGAFDAAINGNLIFRDLMSSDGKRSNPIYYATGGTYGIAVGEMVIGLDIPT